MNIFVGQIALDGLIQASLNSSMNLRPQQVSGNSSSQFQNEDDDQKNCKLQNDFELIRISYTAILIQQEY